MLNTPLNSKDDCTGPRAYKWIPFEKLQEVSNVQNLMLYLFIDLAIYPALGRKDCLSAQAKRVATVKNVGMV